MNELIEKLKDNDAHRIFADMTPEEQACLNKTPKQYIETLTDKNGVPAWVSQWGDHLCAHLVYRIKSDYQPEPEYVDLEITTDCKEGIGLGVHSCFQCQLPRRWMAIHELPSLPGFRGFLDDKGSTLQITWIAERISRGQKVIARFDK